MTNDLAALYRAANANLSLSAGQRRAREKEEAEQRREREKHYKLMEKEHKRREREEKRILKLELKSVTKECNRLDRKMMSKRGLTPEEHGAYEELDALRWSLVQQLDPLGEDWR